MGDRPQQQGGHRLGASEQAGAHLHDRTIGRRAILGMSTADELLAGIGAGCDDGEGRQAGAAVHGHLRRNGDPPARSGVRGTDLLGACLRTRFPVMASAG